MVAAAVVGMSSAPTANAGMFGLMGAGGFGYGGRGFNGHVMHTRGQFRAKMLGRYDRGSNAASATFGCYGSCAPAPTLVDFGWGDGSEVVGEVVVVSPSEVPTPAVPAHAEPAPEAPAGSGSR